MATATRTRKAPTKVQETVEEVEAQETELTTKQVINAGIEKVVQATGVDTQKARYKAMRAIAYQAFIEAIENEDFEALVDRAIDNIDDLPAGWTMELVGKVEEEVQEEPPAPKATTRRDPAKAATPAPAAPKAPARRRPTRKPATSE